MFKFEKLKAWHKAVDLSDKVCMLTIEFPKDEQYILSSQMKRAADSVSLNIAEGSTGQTNREFNRFLSYALRSNIEVIGCLHLARKRNYIDEINFSSIYKDCEEILVMNNALRNTLKY
jgi:four helix bundle protein